MTIPTPTPPRSTDFVLPDRATVSISGEELAASAGITVVRLGRLVALGVVEPVAPGRNEYPATSAARLRRTLRLRADLGVHLADAAIILDLLERLEALEAELARLRSGDVTGS